MNDALFNERLQRKCVYDVDDCQIRPTQVVESVKAQRDSI
jgi:hypothetical protein